MLRLRTPLTEDELLALQILAEREMRNPAEQAHFIIRKELVKCGLVHHKKKSLHNKIAARDDLGGGNTEPGDELDPKSVGELEVPLGE